MPSPTVVDASGASAAAGPCCHAVAVAVGGLLFFADQVPPHQAAGERSDPPGRAKRCRRSFDAVCAAARTTPRRAVRLSVFLTGLDQCAAVDEVWARWLSVHRLVRVTASVAALTRNARVESDAIVAL